MINNLNMFDELKQIKKNYQSKFGSSIKNDFFNLVFK